MDAPLESWKRISPEYLAEQEKLHETGDYGTVSSMYAPIVSSVINKMQVTHLLDYGCGANVTLAKALKVDHKLTYQAYDPAVPRFAKEPLPAQMVCCIDVLEHVEPEHLEGVLDDLVRLTEGIIFLSFATVPALKTLSDGRNAHLTVQPLQWWLPKFWDRWDLQTIQSNNEGFWFVIGTAKVRLEDTSGAQLT